MNEHQTVFINPAAEADQQMVEINPPSNSQILGFDDLDQEIPQESRIPELPAENSPDFPVRVVGLTPELGQYSDQGDFEVGDEAAADGRPHVNPVSVFRTNGFPQLPRRPDPNLPMHLQNLQDPVDRLPPELIPLPRPQDPYNPSRLELRQYISASNKRIMQTFEANNLTFGYLLKNQKKFGYSLTFNMQPRYLSLISPTVQLIGLLAALASIQYNDKKWMVMWVAGDFLANLVIGFIRATSALDIFPFSKMESLILILQVIPQMTLFLLGIEHILTQVLMLIMLCIPLMRAFKPAFGQYYHISPANHTLMTIQSWLVIMYQVNIVSTSSHTLFVLAILLASANCLFQACRVVLILVLRYGIGRKHERLDFEGLAFAGVELLSSIAFVTLYLSMDGFIDPNRDSVKMTVACLIVCCGMSLLQFFSNLAHGDKSNI